MEGPSNSGRNNCLVRIHVSIFLLAVLAALAMPGAWCQVTWPFKGQGIPPDGRTLVTVDTLVDSIESINSAFNSWTAHIWYHLSWNDTRALPIIAAATANWAVNGTCTLPCDWTGLTTGGCCDGIFLPHLDIPNLIAVKQENVPMSRIWPKADKKGIINWSVRVSADYHSPFDFRAWPFEHQHLIMELQIPAAIADRVALTLGDASHLQNTPHTKGAVVPGWHIVSTTKRIYDPSGCYNITNSTSSLWNISSVDASQVSLSALKPDGWAQTSQEAPPHAVFTSVAVTDCQIMVGGTTTAEGLAQYGPRYVLIDIMMKREQSYYVMANIVPLILLAYMVFVTYAMERSDLESRMGVVVTLVLAISALQFTWNFPPASYLNAVQQITLMSYVLYFIVAVESMLASHICRLHQRRKQVQHLQDIVHSPSSVGNTSINDRTMSADPKNAVARGLASGWASGPLVEESGPNGIRSSLGTATSLDVAPSPTGRNSSAAGPQGLFARGGLNAMPDADRTTPQRVGPGPVAEGIMCWPSKHQDSVFGEDVEDPVPSSVGGSRPSGGVLHRGSNGGKKPMGTVPEHSEDSDLKRTTPKWTARTSVGNLGRAMSMRYNAVSKSTKAFQQRIGKDEAFALLFARRMDTIFCWSLLVAYTVTVSVLLYVNSQVGDHKLMLAGSAPPGNM